jgi:hypothetical protein
MLDIKLNTFCTLSLKVEFHFSYKKKKKKKKKNSAHNSISKEMLTIADVYKFNYCG